jgi:hypothetical protein
MAQNFERLWATGTAVEEGSVELTRRPDGLFRFAGALKDGELKIQTTETFQKGVTQFLKPQLVDSYLINNGLRYTVTSDESQPGWVVSFSEETYRFLVDPAAHTVTGELCLPWNEVLIAGSAFAGGSNNVEWNRNAMLPFERDHEDPYVFTWTGELGIFSGVVEPGRFKLEGQMTWGPRELHPFTQDEDILGARQMRQGGDDTKWRVSKAGTYRITVNLFHETIEAELLTDAQQSETDGIHSPEAQPSLSERALSPVYYDANGMHLQHPRRGLNLVRMDDGTVRKVMVR